MSIKKLSLCVLIFLVFAWLAFGDIVDSVVVVYPDTPEHVRETYSKIAEWFKNTDNRYLADKFNTRATGTSSGSGAIISGADGESYILTNHHVMGQARTAKIVFAGRAGGGLSMEGCELIASNSYMDLAILKIPWELPESSIPLSFSKTTVVEGAEVWSAGYPGLVGDPSWQLASGVVTNQKAVIDDLVSEFMEYVIQHSALIDPGSSGGPLLVKTASGYSMVGLNTWSVSGRDNTYFSIPAEHVRKFVESSLGDSEEQPDLSEILSQFKSVLLGNDSTTIAWRNVRDSISSELISEIGWQQFLNYRKNLEESEKSELESELAYGDAYLAMAEGVTHGLSTLKVGNEIDFVYPKSTIADSVTVTLAFGETEETTDWKIVDGDWRLYSASWISTDSKQEQEVEVNNRQKQLDRFYTTGITLRLGMAMPLSNSASFSSNPGVNVGVGFGYYFNPYVGVRSGVDIELVSYTVSENSKKKEYQIGSYVLYARVSGQLPIITKGNKFAVVPFASAGIGAGFNFGGFFSSFFDRSSETAGILNPFIVEIPLSAGIEFGSLSKKEVGMNMWGVEAIYGLPFIGRSFASDVKVGMLRINFRMRFLL